MTTNETTGAPKASTADPMDVTEISTGATPATWDLAQMHPPTAQQPAMDPFAEEAKKAAPEDLDAGAVWPRDPQGPRDPDGTGQPLSQAMGTAGASTAPATDPKVVSAAEPDSDHPGEATVPGGEAGSSKSGSKPTK